MARVVVAPVQSIPPGSRRRIEVEGRGVAVFNVDGTFFALRDVCPHQGARLSAGVLIGTLRASAPGVFEYERERKLIRCPWHGWEYDLATGQSWFDPTRNRVRHYPATVESGCALVAAGTAEPQPGPYVAETIPVTLEDDYVVLEI